jgi:hypothetical protein
MTKMLLLALGLTFAGTAAHAQTTKPAKAKPAGPDEVHKVLALELFADAGFEVGRGFGGGVACISSPKIPAGRAGESGL